MAIEITSGVQGGALKVLIYGPEGIGKTTLAAQFPEPVFIDTEGSTRHMDVRRLPTPDSWAELEALVQWAYANHDKMRTLVIDTADWAEALCSEAVCLRAGKTGIEDFGYGKGYTYLQEAFGGLLDALENVRRKGVHIVLTAHAAMRKFEQPDEMGAYDRWETKLSKKIAPMVKEWADLVLFCNYKTYTVRTDDGKVKARGGQRVMYTTHNPCWDAKNRFGLPEELPMEYASIARVIDGPAGGTLANPSATAKTATPPLSGETTDRQGPSARSSKPSPEREPLPEETKGPPPVKASPTAQDPAAPARPAVDPRLKKLMDASGVTAKEIVDVVSRKGYFPASLPLEKYPTDFVEQVLIAAWDQVRTMISEIRDESEDVPF